MAEIWAAAIGAVVAGGASAGIGAATAPGSPPSPEHQLRRNTRTYYDQLSETIYPKVRAYDNAFTRLQADLSRYGAQRTIGTMEQLAPGVNRLEQQRLGREQGLISQYAPGVRQQLEQYTPQAAGLLRTLGTQAQSELENPYALAPGLRRELEQASFSDSSLRGFGRSPMDAYAAYSSLGAAGEERARQRRQFASGVVGMNQQFYGNPYDYIFRGSGAAPVTAAGVYGLGQSAIRHTPLLTDSSAQQAMPGSAAGSNALMGLGGGLIGAGGNMLGAYMGRPQQQLPPGTYAGAGGNPYFSGTSPQGYPQSLPY